MVSYSKIKRDFNQSMFGNHPGNVSMDSNQAGATMAQPIESFQLSIQQPIAQMRVQAPLGLLRLSMSDLLGASGSNQYIDIEVECLGTYEM
jgi:hypothetical protein